MTNNRLFIFSNERVDILDGITFPIYLLLNE